MNYEKIIEEEVNKKLKELRLKNSLELLEKLNIYKELKEALKNMLLKRLNGDKEFYKISIDKKPDAVVAFSGGVDSSTSTIIAKQIFNVKAVSCYSEYIMTEEMKKNVKKLVKKIGVDLEFIDINLKEVYEDTIKGRYHPCGRCHKIVESAVMNYAKENNVEFVIFGDLLAFGYLALYKDNEIFRFNLPSFFALTKNEERTILKNNGIELKMSYGCPLLKAYHKNNRGYKFTIQRILREVRGRVVDEEEGFKNIIDILELL
ncbi:7-cyano-7-deazaguanine synthase [Methanocaldococcus fervens]|uniref:Queuosine synthesis-like protein n=1 Tax=Methanocaldococcus fervens (strain DSM 4213 / JCM 15782 / AG86) TaxID=573064 RepID=C7P9A5_METFA|nr:7-cyano-7-deazaguanine synthase [Methanocaldococcus fervens]ACV25137.1 Queuosine synthesis-like protein [Methanocaldococcus fervens AG86]